MWRFSKKVSITEGLRNRMEEIIRRAYGFRNFENFRLRVYIIVRNTCSTAPVHHRQSPTSSVHPVEPQVHPKLFDAKPWCRGREN